MATATKALKYDSSTDVNFGQWGGGIEDAIVTTAAWARTSDTGQTGMKPGTVTFTQRTTTVATVTFTAGPIYYVGQKLTIAGTSVAALNIGATVTGVTTTTITYAVATGSNTTTADTGTINPTRPSASAFVYQIFKMADTLQATAPVFIKFEWGQSSAGTVPQVAFTLGTGSDGAGNLTGITNTRIAMSAATSGATGATTHSCYFSGDTNRLMMVLFQDMSSVQSFGLQIERAHDTTGADVSTYFSFLCFYNAGMVLQSLFGILGTAPTAETTSCPMKAPTVTTFNSNSWFCPVFPVIGQMGNPMIAGACHGTDTTNLSTPSINFYGGAHTMLALTGASFSTINNDGALAAMLRFD